MAEFNGTKIIQILDPQTATLKETVLEEKPVTTGLFENMRHSSGRSMTLLEVAENNLSVFPHLLRDGLRAILFESYAGVPTTYQQWAKVESSDRPEENWLEEAGIGLLPQVGEGDAYPHIVRDISRTVQIKNAKYGGIISVTEEMMMFNRVGILKQQAQMLGRAAAMTKDQTAYNVLTTAGNYVRTAVAGDNDIGANTNATTFSAAGLELAFSTLQSMKDRVSGMYLGVMPNTLVVGPRLQFAAKQLLTSGVISRAHGVQTAEVYGTGTDNAFYGLIDTIIVSPFVQSYSWVLMERNRAVVCQQVLPLQLLQSSMTADNPSYLGFDQIDYRAREFYGFGMLNDRFAYYSSATAAPGVG